MSRMPLVAILGRQNVGKSTLFNVLVESPRALVSPIAGTTRDRNIANFQWRGKSWAVVDTGGIEARPSDPIGASVRRQAEYALKSADVICFVIDGNEGLTEEDQLIARLLRKSKKPVVLAINKLDAPRMRAGVSDEFQRMGFEKRVLLSAKNGTGTGDLLDIITEILPKREAPEPPDDIRFILMGKPNVGKSSIINRLLGEERVIVSPEPHTTRDPQDIILTYAGTRFRLIDTAGIRRQAKLARRLRKESLAKLEQQSVEKSLRALRGADIAALIVDITQPITKQDRHLFQELEGSGVGLFLVANKWDLIKEKTVTSQREYEDRIRRDLPFLTWAPLVFVSALTRQRLVELLIMAKKIQESRLTRITDRSLERFVKHIVSRRTPPRTENIQTRILSMVQTNVAPPTFHILVGPRQELASSYRRYIMNSLRDYYHFYGTTIRLDIEQQLRK